MKYLHYLFSSHVLLLFHKQAEYDASVSVPVAPTLPDKYMFMIPQSDDGSHQDYVEIMTLAYDESSGAYVELAPGVADIRCQKHAALNYTCYIVMDTLNVQCYSVKIVGASLYDAGISPVAPLGMYTPFYLLLFDYLSNFYAIC